MQASLIDIQKFEPQHLDAAVELSRQPVGHTAGKTGRSSFH